MKAQLLALASVALLSGRAHAESPKWFSAELGGGGVQLISPTVRTVYGSRNQPAFHARVGVLVKSILDVGVGGDFTQITGKRVGVVSGGQSAEPSQLTLAPLYGTALLRLDFFHNQPIVPYGGGGIAYLVWGERDLYANKSITGDKYGWTAVGGLQILLDNFEPGRAADLDSWDGVNDTFLNLEVSRTEYDRLGKGQTGLELSHWTGRATIMFEF